MVDSTTLSSDATIASTSTPKINLAQKIVAVRRELGVVEKGKQMKGSQNYKYVAYDDLMAKLRPLLNKYGILLIAQQQEGHVREIKTRNGGDMFIVTTPMSFTLIDADNPSDRIDNLEWVGEGSDTGDKAYSKASSNGHKNFWLKNMLASDVDPDDEESPPDVVAHPKKKPVVSGDMKALGDAIRKATGLELKTLAEWKQVTTANGLVAPRSAMEVASRTFLQGVYDAVVGEEV